ncbi:MAG: class I SAM-dependent methyltransferase [Alphaproteobacteria bacterium]
MSDLDAGRIRFVFPDGREIECLGVQRGPNADLKFHSYAGIFRLAFGGYTGLGEGYLAADWSTTSLRNLFQFGITNQDSLRKRLAGAAPVLLLRKFLRFTERNTQTGSKRNIAYHYDLGNAFYENWLDPSMTYSSALFEPGVKDLQDAQQAKYRRIVDQLDILPHHRVLEIGCGWGGFAEFAARETGASITAITISQEQFDYATRRIANAGLQGRVQIELIDYRKVSGEFDRVVSIEMLEAVGEAYWPDYFRVVSNSLKKDGRGMIQVITVPDERFENYRKKTDFIQRYIFPGGMLISPGEMAKQASETGLTIADAYFFGRSYGHTLDLWHDRFSERWTQIENQGFDDRFRRLWEYYLNYTSAGFHAGTISVGQFLLTKNR